MPPLRQAVRALVLAPGPKLLLVRFRFAPLVFWAPPGGGIELGEGEEDALRRELREEVGLVDPALGPVVYTHERSYVGRHGGQRDVVRRVDVDTTFAPRPHLTEDELRREHVDALRWFSLAELRNLSLLPFDLAEIVAGLDDHSAPQHLDDLRVPPVLVAVSGPDDDAFARKLARVVGLPYTGGADWEETAATLRSGRSAVLTQPPAGLAAIQQAAGRRVQVVRVLLPGHRAPDRLDGTVLPVRQSGSEGLEQAIDFVESILPARGH